MQFQQQRVLQKVRGLLAKAESTEFGDEAEAFMAKAQELIRRYSLDALLDVRETEATPIQRKIDVEKPYQSQKVHLLNQIASANHCRCVFSSYGWVTTLVGFESDIEMAELLFTSLLAQGLKSLNDARPPQWMAGSELRAFKSAFWHGFASRIGSRLHEAAQRVDADNADLLPVLKRRDDEVDEAVREAFPQLRTRTRSNSRLDAFGWNAGSQAADGAVLKQHPRLGEAS